MTIDLMYAPVPTLDLLLRCLQQAWSAATVAQIAALPAPAWTALVAEAHGQKVATLLYHRCCQHGLATQLPPAVQARLLGLQQQTAARNLLLYHQLRLLLAEFQQHAIPVLLLKGAYLAATVYDDSALRHMVDADLLVPESALGAAIEIVTALGYEPLQPLSPVESYLAHHHHLPFFMKAGSLSVEIHWTITRPDQPYTIAMADLWARAQTATVAGRAVAALAPEDLLLHVCLHATYQHLLEQGIRFLCDIDAICRHFGPQLEWELVVARAQQWGWGPGVYLALQLATDLLAAPVPPAVLTALAPAGAIDQVRLVKHALGIRQAAARYSISREFAQMWRTPRLRDKGGQLWQRLFLPRAYMAVCYGVAPDSPWLTWYYLRRWGELVGRYGRILWGRRQGTLADAAQFKVQLTTWLEDRA